MLEMRRVDRAGGPKDPIIVLLHGRGATAADLEPLADRLPPAVYAFPEAPFTAAQWGYGPGRAWYRYVGDDRPEPYTFSKSLSRLAAFLDALADEPGAHARALVVGGFSQGGTLSLGYAILRPGVVAGVLNFSGFLADHPEVELADERIRGLPVFWGHGLRDPAIPFTLATTGRERLRAAGADLEAHDYAIGHWIDADELSDAARWIARVAGTA
ncbi:MAG: alpha/beta hydrolase [Longimicrobiales bacterium]